MTKEIVTELLPAENSHKLLKEKPAQISQVDCHHKVMHSIAKRCSRFMKVN
jgi:hypothetical protein